MRPIGALLERRQGTMVAEGAMETALSEFVRRLPVGHLRFENASAAQQVLCIGGRVIQRGPSQSSLAIGNRCEVYIESVTRRVHCFNYQGPHLWIDQAVVEEIAAIANEWGQPARAHEGREIFYLDGIGCWTVRRPLEGRAHVGRFVCEPECSLFDAQEWRDSLRESLVVPFTDAYPELRHDAELAVEVLVSAGLSQIDAFLDRLQHKAVDACRDVDWPTASGFNFFANTDERVPLYRHQAARAIPILGVLFRYRRKKDVDWILEAVDMRRPLLDAAAHAFDVPRETVRFLVGKQLEELGLQDGDERLTLWIHGAPLLMRSLAAMEPDHRPRTSGQWTVFYDLLLAADRWVLFPWSAVSSFLREAGRQGLGVTCARIARRYGRLSAISDCRHFLESLRRSVGKQAVERFVERIGVCGLLEESKRWHIAVFHEATHRIAESDGCDAFATPFSLPCSIEGLEVRFLDSYAALVEEGMRMEHCLSTLYRDCVTGKRLAFSLRGPGGNPAATFDVSIVSGTAGEPEARLNEIRGRRNANAGPECVLAVGKFLEEIKGELRKCPGAAEAWIRRCSSKRRERVDRRPANLVEEIGREAARSLFRRVRGLA